MTSGGQEPSIQQQPTRLASPPKERSQTPKILTPVVATPDVTENPPTKRRSVSPMPPSAHSDTFQNPFNAPSFHSHGFPQGSGTHSLSAPPPEPSISSLDHNKPVSRPFARPSQFKIQTSGPKIGGEIKASPDDVAMLDAMFAKEEERKRNQTVKSRKGSRAGHEGHRRTSSTGLTTIPYIPKGFRSIVSNEPQQTPLMQAIHNPISLDTGPSTHIAFGPQISRLQSPHQAGPPKLGLNTQFGSRTGSPEPGLSATPTTAASPGSPMSRRKSRAQGDGSEKPPGSAKPRARQRSLLPKSSIQFESVPYPFPNSESSVFVQVSPRNSTTSLQFQPPLVPYQPPPQHHQHQLPPQHHGSPPPPSHAGPPGPPPGPPPPHGMYMSPVGPPPGAPHFGPPPPSYQHHFGLHQGMPSPSSQHQSLPPPRPPPPPPPQVGSGNPFSGNGANQGGSGNPFSGNGAHPPPEFRPIDYRGPPPHHHEFSPIISPAGTHVDGLRQALFSRPDRPQDRRLSSSRTTPFSGPPSTFMDDVTSPTTGPHFHSGNNFQNFERRDQPIVAPKSPTPPGQHHTEHTNKLGYPLGPPLQFISHPSNPPPTFPQHQPISSSQQPSLSLTTNLASPIKESPSSFFPPTTPTTSRKKQSDKNKSASKTPATGAPVRVSLNTKHPAPPPSPSPKTPKTSDGGSVGRDNPISPAASLIKRRSAYVAGGGIKTTDLALPKPPESVEPPTPVLDQPPVATPVDTEQILTFNKPRKRNKANPSVLRTREKEVDDAMTEDLDDPEDQLAREMIEAEKREHEEPIGLKRQRTKSKTSREPEIEKPAPKKRGRKAKKLELTDEDENMELGEPESEEIEKRSTRPRRNTTTRKGKEPIYVDSSDDEDEGEEEVDSVEEKARPGRRRQPARAAQRDQQQLRRSTRKRGGDESSDNNDDMSETPSTAPRLRLKIGVDEDESSDDGKAAAAVRAPPQRGRGRRRTTMTRAPAPTKKTRSKVNGISPEAESDASADLSSDDDEYDGELIVNGKVITVPPIPPLPAGVSGKRTVWKKYVERERPKFTEGRKYLEAEHTILRLKDWERRRHYKIPKKYLDQAILVGDDGYTDTEWDFEQYQREVDAKGDQKNGKPEDKAGEKSEDAEHKTYMGSSAVPEGQMASVLVELAEEETAEPISAAETPRDEFPPATVRGLSNLSFVAKIDGDGSADVPTPMEDVLGSTALATPAAEVDDGPSPMEGILPTVPADVSPADASPVFPLTHEFGFGGHHGDLPPPGKASKHTERKRKRTLSMSDAKDLKGRKWIEPHFEGRSKELLRQVLIAREEQVKKRIEEEAQAQLDDTGEPKAKGKKGGRKGRKGKPDLKNLAYAREVRRAKLAGTRAASTPSSAVGEESQMSEVDDLSENSDHSSDWSSDGEEEPSQQWLATEEKYQAAMQNPKMKEFLEDFGSRFFPVIYNVPDDATRNRGPVYTNAEEFGGAIDMAIDMGDTNLLQSVTQNIIVQSSMIIDEKQHLDAYRVNRGWVKPEDIAPKNKRKAQDAGLDDNGDDDSQPRYATRKRAARNQDEDATQTPQEAQVPEKDPEHFTGNLTVVRGYQETRRRYFNGEPIEKEKKTRGRGGARGGRVASAANIIKAAGETKIVEPTPPFPYPASGRGRGGSTPTRGRGGRGRGRGRGSSTA
ncbi:hypothetical protein ABW19_dt0209490 [Dactylella cylindrospora]|nr:hypothetical protein ABW19_dt0209490 [Dactylella cylindrospora]